MNTYRPNDYKTPRTAQQAFGPYAVVHPTESRPSAWTIIGTITVVLFLCGVSVFAAIVASS